MQGEAPRPGDPAAEFEVFVRAEADRVGRLAYLLLGNHHDADDLAAEVMVACWEQWSTVSAATSPTAYARSITVKKAASRIRRLRTGRAKLALLRGGHSETQQPTAGESVDVRRALAALPPRRRACAVLRLAFGLSEREVADTLGVSVGTVKSQTYKAVRELRHLLGDAGLDRDDVHHVHDVHDAPEQPSGDHRRTDTGGRKPR